MILIHNNHNYSSYMIFVRCIPHYYCLLQSRCKGHFETVDWSIQLKHWQDKYLAFQVDLWMQSLADPWMHTQCHGIILLCMLSPPQGGCYIYCILCNLNYCRPCNRSKCIVLHISLSLSLLMRACGISSI